MERPDAVNWPASLAMLGCGNMGGAMLGRWLAAGLPPERVTVINRSGTPPFPGLRTVTDVPSAAPEVLVVGVKPQQLAVAEAAVAAMDAPPAVLISILAGVDLATLKARLPAGAVVRAMPNLPVALGQGVTMLHGDARARDSAEALMRPLGLAEWTDDEGVFDKAGMLTGCGPGYVFRIIDAYARAGEKLGLSPEQSARLARATITGAAAQAAASDLPPRDLASRVASKGGSTQAGYDVFDADDALVDLLTRVLEASEARSLEMGAEARAIS